MLLRLLSFAAYQTYTNTYSRGMLMLHKRIEQLYVWRRGYHTFVRVTGADLLNRIYLEHLQ